MSKFVNGTPYLAIYAADVPSVSEQPVILEVFIVTGDTLRPGDFDTKYNKRLFLA